MPKRKRNHILEDESKDYFKSLLPNHWIWREKSHDYGIDGEVEIWDKVGEDAEPTSLVFNVQLKATDSKKLTTQKELRVRPDSFDYWLKQDIPTLLVRYCSNKEEPIVYFTWNYDFRLQQTKSGKSYSISFTDSNLWCSTTPKELQRNISSDRELNSAHLKTPVILHFKNRADFPEENNWLREKMLPFRELVDFRNPPENHPTIELFYANDIWVVEANCRNCLVLSNSKETREHLCHDLVLATGLSLSILGHGNLLPRFLSKTAEKTELLKEDFMCDQIAKGLIKSGNIQTLRELTLTCISRKLEAKTIWALLFAPIDHLEHLDEAELPKHLDFFAEVEELVSITNPDLLGLVLYVKGSYQTSLHQSKDALQSFKDAIRTKNSIIVVPNLWTQTGGALFWRKRFNAAEYCYVFALRLQPQKEGQTMANLADTLWRKGKIGAAKFWLRRALKDPEFKKDARYKVCLLSLHGLKFISEITGESRLQMKSQEVIDEILEAEKSESQFSEEQILSLLKRKISDSWLWAKLAIALEDKDPEAAFNCRIVFTMCDYRDVETWSSLLLEALTKKSCSQKLMIKVADASLALHPERIAYQMHLLAEEQTVPGAREAVAKFANALDTIPKKKLARTIRPVPSNY